MSLVPRIGTDKEQRILEKWQHIGFLKIKRPLTGKDPSDSGRNISVWLYWCPEPSHCPQDPLWFAGLVSLDLRVSPALDETILSGTLPRPCPAHPAVSMVHRSPTRLGLSPLPLPAHTAPGITPGNQAHASIARRPPHPHVHRPHWPHRRLLQWHKTPEHSAASPSETDNIRGVFQWMTPLPSPPYCTARNPEVPPYPLLHFPSAHSHIPCSWFPKCPSVLFSSTTPSRPPLPFPGTAAKTTQMSLKSSQTPPGFSFFFHTLILQPEWPSLTLVWSHDSWVSPST